MRTKLLFVRKWEDMWTKLTFCKKMRRYVNQREAQTSLKTWPNPYPRTRRKGNFFFASSDFLPIFWKCPSSIDSKGSLQCLYWRLSFCFIYKQVVLGGIVLLWFKSFSETPTYVQVSERVRISSGVRPHHMLCVHMLSHMRPLSFLQPPQ